MANIKIIDDDREFAANIAAILTKNGHSVKIMHSTENAVENLTVDKPDLLILDVMFPENPVAGFELARAIHQKKELRDLPVLLLTGINQEFPMDFSSSDINTNWMPIHGFAEKPITAARLARKIKELLSPEITPESKDFPGQNPPQTFSGEKKL